MKSWAVVCLFALCCSSPAFGSNPLGSVIQLLNELSAKVEKDGQAEEAAYREFTDWCNGAAQNGLFAVETEQKEQAKKEAEVQKDRSDIEQAKAKIEELAATAAEASAEKKKATEQREKARADFLAGEKELTEMIGALGRAVDVLQKKGATALAQVDTANMKSLVEALGAVLDAASFPTSDRSKLLALVQSKEDAEDDREPEAAVGAPQAEAYESKSGDIVSVLEDMKEDAETQLAKLRQAELEAKGNYDVLMLSLKDSIGDDTKEIDDQKGEKSEASEEKAEDTGDLQETTEELKDSSKELSTVQHTCLSSAADHDETVASRKAELAAIAKAIEILTEVAQGGAAEGGASFLQVASATAEGLARSEAVFAVKRLAKQQHSAALAQLAVRMTAVMRSKAADPFAKVKEMISNMITKLETEGASMAKEKAYCDKEMGKSSEKDEKLTDDLSDLTATIDSAASKSATLKEQVKQLEASLGALIKEQAELDKVHAEQQADWAKEEDDLKKAVQGVRQALGVLRDYYGGSEEGSAAEAGGAGAFLQQPAPPQKHTKNEGAGSSLIEMLEVVESDFATSLAKVQSTMADEQADYDKMTGENKVTLASKKKDVEFKTAEAKRLDTTMAENSEDQETASSELAAVEEYLAELKKKCVAKPESYEERQKRRAAEIKGLKDALATLNEEAAAFLQRSRRSRRSLRAHPALDAAAKP